MKKTIKCCGEMKDRLIEALEPNSPGINPLVIFKVEVGKNIPGILHMKFCPFCGIEINITDE